MNYRNVELRTIQSHTHEEMGKKNKARGSEMKEKAKEMVPLYTDTTYNRNAGILTWESMYRLLEEENPKIMKVSAGTGSQHSSEASLEELACSFLHRIAARPKILPYTDMIKWILDNAEMNNRQFKIQGHGLI